MGGASSSQTVQAASVASLPPSTAADTAPPAECPMHKGDATSTASATPAQTIPAECPMHNKAGTGDGAPSPAKGTANAGVIPSECPMHQSNTQSPAAGDGWVSECPMSGGASALAAESQTDDIDPANRVSCSLDAYIYILSTENQKVFNSVFNIDL